MPRHTARCRPTTMGRVTCGPTIIKTNIQTEFLRLQCLFIKRPRHNVFGLSVRSSVCCPSFNSYWFCLRAPGYGCTLGLLVGGGLQDKCLSYSYSYSFIRRNSFISLLNSWEISMKLDVNIHYCVRWSIAEKIFKVTGSTVKIIRAQVSML